MFYYELQAVHQSIRHFRHIVESTPFITKTDHRSLITALAKSGDAWSPRQQCHVSSIAGIGGTLTYLPGSQNPVADALSCIAIYIYIIGL